MSYKWLDFPRASKKAPLPFGASLREPFDDIIIFPSLVRAGNIVYGKKTNDDSSPPK